MKLSPLFLIFLFFFFFSIFSFLFFLFYLTRYNITNNNIDHQLKLVYIWL